MPGRRAVLALLLLLGLAGLGACRVDTSLTITVEPDGSGTVGFTVALDADAVTQAEASGTPLESAVRLLDLVAAGWATKGWQRDPSGGATITFTKSFARADELADRLRELAGDDGPLRDAALTREDSFFTTGYRFEATVDLADVATGVLDDPELVAALQAGGVDPAALDAELAAGAASALSVAVEVRLPGAAPRRWEVAPGESSTVRTGSSVLDGGRLVGLAVAAGLAVLAVTLLVVGERRARRRRRRR